MPEPILLLCEGGHGLKRTLTLPTLIVCLLLVIAGGAHASTDSTYATWAATGANAAVPTPHSGYSTATNKCAVCHAVHKAEPSGELLLSSSVAEACTYCHITTGAGNIQIYDEDVTNYSTNSNYAHNGTGYSNCTDCHSVHGADTIAGANETKILKDWLQDGSVYSYSTYALAKWPDPASVSADDAQITAWCTGCHKYFIQSYDQSSTSIAYIEFVDPFTGYDWASTRAGSHVMTAPGGASGAYSNPAASSDVTDNVAWGTSQYCRSCHDAGITDTAGGVVTTSFPHFTPSYYRFMKVAESLAASSTQDASSSQNTTGTVDGLCLKCHKADSATGVGYDY